MAFGSWIFRALSRAIGRRHADDDEPPLTTRDYDRVYAQIDPAQLHEQDDVFSSQELLLELTHRDARSELFLSFYSPRGVHRALQRYGFVKLLKDKGFEPVLELETTDPALHALRIYDGVVERDHLLIELLAGFRTLKLPAGETCRMLFIDWLMMQNPYASFADDEPKLPEQSCPGLGLFREFGQLLRLMGTRLDCDGLMNHPAHYHNAFLYSKFMHFVSPEEEGRFRALMRDLHGLELCDASRVVDDGHVSDGSAQPVSWQGTDQVMPITLRLSTYFDSPAYRETVESTQAALRFVVTETD